VAERGDEPHRAQRILIIDDDPATADVVRKWLGSQYEILAAAEGTSGARLAASEQPDLVLLDLKMPGEDGLSVARRLKDDPATATIPIILLTACRDVNTKVQAFAAGADDYVTKPFDMGEVEARIRSELRKGARLRQLMTTQEHLEQMLRLDEKTGLYNFRMFQQRLREEWQRSTRYAVPLSLVLLDLDDFKRVNDTLGHPAGDDVLQEFATLVAGGARANDVAARYGGEEFAVILPHTDGAMAWRVADRIVRAVADFVFLEARTPTRVTVSAGLSTWPSTPDVESVDALVRAADRALYRAKDQGKNRVVQA
jgi:diguanylate cyclase (GGDEF)-like protein